MMFKYSLSENDILQYYLFTASTTNRFKKQKNRDLILLTFAFLCLSLIFYQSGNKLMTYYFLGFALVTLCFYPWYLKRHHRKHYKKFVFENLKNRFGVEATIHFKEDYIETTDVSGESKINHSAIEQFTETGEYVYIKLKAGESIIIPKSKIEHYQNLKTYFEMMAKKLNVKYESFPHWKW